MPMSKLLLIGLIIVVTVLSVCASDACQQEELRLRQQEKSLEARVLQQQQLIQRLQKLNEFEETGDPDQLHLLAGHRDYRDCAHIYTNGTKVSGFFLVRPAGSPAPVRVFCDMMEGGGWTVIQRRLDGSQSFNRSWSEYKEGFGDFQLARGEFWLGNDNLHLLTSQDKYNLRIDLEDFEGSHRFADYKDIRVANEEDHYQLQFGEYSGTAGDALSGNNHPDVQAWANHQGMNFSTHDRDNDRYEGNCAVEDKAGWWFNKCHSANLNGVYYQGPYSAVTDDGLVWFPWHGWWYSLKSVAMKIRPDSFEPDAVA